MMEALKQQETKIEANLEDAATATQQNNTQNEFVENVENKNSHIAVVDKKENDEEKKEENLSKSEDVNDASETTKFALAEAEAKESDADFSDHNDETPEEKGASSTQNATLEATAAAATAEVTATSDLNLLNRKTNEICETIKSPKATKISLVDYDDVDDEEVLLKSDQEEEEENEQEDDVAKQAHEKEVLVEEENPAPTEKGEPVEVVDNSLEKEESTVEAAKDEEDEVMDISAENEDELLKSDEEIEAAAEESNVLEVDEAEINAVAANKDKEVVTISDEEEEGEEKDQMKADERVGITQQQQQMESEETTSNAVDQVKNSSPSNEVISLDDDDSLDNAASAASNDNQHNKNTEITKSLTNEEAAGEDEDAEIDERKPPQHTENNYISEQRLLYKFDIDDSNDSSIRQGGDYRVPRDDEMDEESHDTFASINDDSRLGGAGTGADSNQDANLKLLAASAEKVKDRAEAEEAEAEAEMEEKEHFVTLQTTQYEAPKVNGDHHKSTQETEEQVNVEDDDDEEEEKEEEKELHDDTKGEEDEEEVNDDEDDEAVIAVISDPNAEQTQSAEMQPREEFFSATAAAAWPQTDAEIADNSNNEVLHLNSEENLQNELKMETDEIADRTAEQHVFNESAETLASNEAADVNIIDDDNNDDDDASRCSSLASSVATSETSSSHQLVIDHPMEDLLEAKASGSTTTTTATEKLTVTPLKLTLKRKLSNSSDTSGNNVFSSPVHKQPHLELENINESLDADAQEAAFVKHEMPELSQNHVQPLECEEEQENLLAEIVPQPLFKSLLLEQLQKPRTPPVAYAAQDTFVVPAEPALPPEPASPLPAIATTPSPPATKYLCFKCKRGSFDSHAALSAHQLSCLATSMSAMFPPPPPPPMQLEKAATPPPPAPPTVVASAQPLAESTKSVAAATPPPPPTPTPQKIRYYKCSTCGTYHENWNLFLHVREKHNRHMCLYCIRFFPTAEKLSLHLEIKHDLEQNHFNSVEALRLSQRPKELEGVAPGVWEARETRLLLCCTCQHVFREDEPFSDHVCAEFMLPCALCGQKGRHTNQCKAHPDAKRRASKVKKKATKQKDGSGANAATSDMGAQRSQYASQPPLTTASHTSSYCDNNFEQRSSNVPKTIYSNLPPLLPPPPPTSATTTGNFKPQHSEDSNDSSNMVIDESCTNTTHHTYSLVNPFKALDERERADAERQFPAPPERGETELQQQQQEKPIKLKLCVPRKFQKPVGAAISSSEESEECEEEEEDEENSTTEENKNSESTANDASFTSTPKDDMPPTEMETSQHNVTHSGAADEEESLEEPPNSNMKRLIAEIERTQLAIQHTKESLHHTHKAAPTSSCGSTPRRQATLSQSSTRTTDRNWSPTPPASPNSRWPQSEQHSKASQQQQHEERSLLSPHTEEPQPALPAAIPAPAPERRNTVGSDVMDIDDTITGNVTAIISASQQMQSPPENTSQTSSENVDSSATSGNKSVDIEHNSSIEEEDTDAQLLPPPPDIREAITVTATQPLNIDESLIKPEEPATAAPAVNYERTHDEHAANQSFSTSEDQEEEHEVNVCDNKPDDDQGEHEDESESPTAAAAEVSPTQPVDDIEVAKNDMPVVDLLLDRPLEKFEIVEFVRICLKAVYPVCLYCNHARRIAVNGRNLVLHMIAAHTFTATVDSITAEELKSETIVAKLKSFLPALEHEYFNSTSYCTMGDGQFTRHFNERIFECFNCRYATTTFKELYLHNRKMHTKEPIRCIMCLEHFYTFSEVLCHICPGERNRTPITDVKYRCCLCNVDNIPSPFRMMVHLRKRHTACDVCLEDCRDQNRLASHVWKHKLSHLCYRCGISYRNKLDITKHLFWKHGTESIMCNRCTVKRWRHFYHFCIPPADFVCDVCQMRFSKAVYLKVHKRIHSGDFRYPCTDENCEQKFISRRLMLKHTSAEHPPEELLQLKKIGEDVAEISEEATKAESSEAGGDAVKQEAPLEIKKEIMENCDAAKTEEKAEESEQLKKEASELKKESDENTKFESKNEENKPAATSTSTRKKKKKTKRAKESLDDLNLIAPNLSESDSDDDGSGTETRSRAGEENELVPRVMLSPPSEAENELETNAATLGNEADRTGKVLEIWKNFLQSQSGAGGDAPAEVLPIETEANYTEDNYPTPASLHVAYSDHDYCNMQRPATPPPLEKSKTSPSKRKNSTKRRTNSAHHGDDESSSSSDSSSSSGSSCCSRSNCSCSSSGSENSSSSSSSSNDDSDSSAGSNATRKGRQRKKSERDAQRKKSESLSPLKKSKQHHNSHSEAPIPEEPLQSTPEADNKAVEAAAVTPPPNEPLFYESDLDSVESDTDEDFYDEHPQQLHTLLLAQKRAELMAQRQLSPSYNYDIVENSRPSTPSLPEDAAASAGAAHDKRSKLKKKKRERKWTSRSEAKTSTELDAQQEPQQEQQQQQPPPYEHMQPTPGMAEAPAAQQTHALPQHYAAIQPQAPPAHLLPRASYAPNHALMGARGVGGRMSEGSSCSDADASLKRSKRVPRPNKFFGFEGDDENTGSIAAGGGGGANHQQTAQPLMIGMRAFKPQPPPDLKWPKEDLPTPSKSILNNKNKAPRLPRTPASAPPLGAGAAAAGLFISSGHSGTPLSSQAKSSTSSSSRKKRPQQLRNNLSAASAEKSLKRKRPTKKAASTPKLPPIPTLKIRGIGAAGGAGGTNHIPASQIYSSSRDSDDDDSSRDSSSADEMSTSTPNNRHNKVRVLDASADVSGVGHGIGGAASSSANHWNITLKMVNEEAAAASAAPQVLPPVLSMLPAPPASGTLQTIAPSVPPALMPNPDFARLQYFKANNIRYPICPPAGARQAREGESVYCYCRCPYDEVSEMIACDGENCIIEWFHFECVGIMVAPQGKWFCAECRPKYSEELYPNSVGH